MEDHAPENKPAEAVPRFPYGGRIAILFLVPFMGVGFSEAAFLPSLILYAVLWPLAVTDWHVGRLPNVWTAVLLVTGFVVNSRYGVLPFADYAVGAAAGFLALFTLGVLYKTIRHRDGLGMGDAKFMAGCGAWLGWPFLPFVLLVASITALLYVGGRWLMGHAVDMKIRLAFGPFLCLSTWAVWLFLPYKII